MWPTKTVDIDGYDGWNVTIRDLTVRQVRELDGQTDITTLVQVLLPSIVSWTCTDPDGAALPVSEDGISMLPMKVATHIFGAIYAHINDDMIPKETSGSES